MSKKWSFSYGNMIINDDTLIVELNKNGTNVQEVEQLDELKKPHPLFFSLQNREMNQEWIRLTYERTPGYFAFHEILSISQKEKQKLALALLDIKQIEGTQFTTTIEPHNVFFRQDGKVKFLHRGIRSVLPPEQVERKTFLYQLKCLIVSLFSGIEFAQLVEQGFIKGKSNSELVDQLIQAKSLRQLQEVLEKEYPEPKANESMAGTDEPLQGGPHPESGKAKKQVSANAGAGNAKGNEKGKGHVEKAKPKPNEKSPSKKAKVKQQTQKGSPLVGPSPGMQQEAQPNHGQSQQPFPSYNHAPGQQQVTAPRSNYQAVSQPNESKKQKGQQVEKKSFLQSFNRNQIVAMVGVLLIGLILGALFFYVGSARPVMTAFSDEMTASQQTYSELETEKEELEGELQTQEQKLSAYQVMATGEVEHAITAFEQLPDKTTADNEALAQLYIRDNTVDSWLKLFALGQEERAVEGLSQLNNDEANEALLGLDSENPVVILEQARINGEHEQIIALYEGELSDHGRAQALAGNSYLQQGDLDTAREIAVEREDTGLQIRILEREIELVNEDDDLDDDEKEDEIEALENQIDDLS
ncbi:type VII secretion protein EssB/YukC [Alkalihalobacillus pseudalcaliphilus]|uniref:type VII secretion protein EssB/YukC n=1 Tax=Alkalihalobacillus pseudalcaliphilus TaxID=79884 RepID=UPI00064DBE8F|nr:type VII secretion protein EssB/YukC [Alkalihalobacillus pseudalcaliphilus]KMK78255.1 hypothetical protein AB990_02130 [Alkalihalobacillus pseudalcaliphilus]